MPKMRINVKEVPENSMYMWQEAFTLENKKGEKVATYGTTVPGGLPYIFIDAGLNKGKRFVIDTDELKMVIDKLLSAT